jgi:hypothetical protein
MVFTVSWSAQKCRGVESNFWVWRGFILMKRISQDSSVRAATRPWLDEVGCNLWQGKEIFLSPKCQDWLCIEVVLLPEKKRSWGMKLTTHPVCCWVKE